MRAFMFFALTALTLMSNFQTPQSGRLPASDREPSSGYSCRIATGDITVVGRGSSKLEATENARVLCGSKMIDQHYAARRSIDESAELELACVNLNCI